MGDQRNRMPPSAAGIVLALATLAPLAWAHAADSRFALAGAASLGPAGAPQEGGRLRLRATLRLDGAGDATARGGGFALRAKLAAAPLACASDTIFRDGFDP